MSKNFLKRNTRHTLIVTHDATTKDFEKNLPKLITPSNKYAVHFEDLTLEIPFIRCCQKLFTSELIIIRCKKLLEDVENPETQKQLILQYHAINHNGIVETVEHLQTRFYWPHLREQIRNVINQCNSCQRNKYERHPNQVENQGPISADHPFAQIHIDTFCFEQSRILTIVDVFSKYGQGYILPNGTALAALNQLRIFFSHHGFPTNITHDQGGEFENRLLQEYCKSLNINYHATTPLNSSSNSPVERLNSTLLEKLRILRDNDKFTPLDQLLVTAILNYNSSIHSTTKRPPFNILYGPHYDALEHIFTPTTRIDEYLQRQNDQHRALQETRPEPNTSNFQHNYAIGEVVYVLNPNTRNKKSGNLYNEGTIVKIEGNRIHCKMKNGRMHVRNFRNVKPKRKSLPITGSPQDLVQS